MKIRHRWFLAVSVTLVLPASGLASSSQVAVAPVTGVITGRVVDQSGRPLVWASVHAVRRLKRWNGPYYEAMSVAQDESDDRGQFRLHSLRPGTYFVAVSASSTSVRRQTTPAPPGGTAYYRTYNPGTASLENAESIVVQAGGVREVSVLMTPTPLFAISGTVRTASGMAAAGFSVLLRGLSQETRLAAADGRLLPQASIGTQVNQDGSFSIAAPAGEYVLAIDNGQRFQRTKEPFESGDRVVTIGSTPMTDLRITTTEGATVRGRIVLNEDPQARAFGTLRAVPTPGVSIHGGYEATVQPDGTFEFVGLSGLRRFEALQLPFNWMITGVEAPGDMRIAEYLDFTSGRTVENLKIIATNRVGELQGTVSDINDDSRDERIVLLLPRSPTARDYRGRDYAGFSRVTRFPDGMHRYFATPVPPGTYLAVATDVRLQDLLGDSDLMEKARAAATSINVQPGVMQLPLRLTSLRQYIESRDAQ